mmetsp:Transcript_5115/g.21019  ORF Transcript_5115/g.21019 Transcript_5115/m.21019 type:complete len:101 (+) Transcript_5115:214-516(+)
MFEAACSAPAETASCGLFAGPKNATADFLSLSLEEFLSKLDLLEYHKAFEAAGIGDVEGLTRLSDDDLDAFNLRKLEKRKLVHHLNKARTPDEKAALCGT